MTAGQDPSRWRRQIERLLAYPGVGALAPHGIASNLGATQEEIQPVLDALLREGRIVRVEDGRLLARAGAKGGAEERAAEPVEPSAARAGGEVDATDATPRAG